MFFAEFVDFTLKMKYVDSSAIPAETSLVDTFLGSSGRSTFQGARFVPIECPLKTLLPKD